MKFSAVIAFLCLCLIRVEGGHLKTLNPHDLKRMSEYQSEIDENVRKFKENLEGLKTTVDFEAITV